MAKLSKEQITKELNDKGFKPVDIENYNNLKSPIIIECENGHQLRVNMHKVRKGTFRCPICNGGDVNIQSKTEPPKRTEETKERVVSLDNASKNMGLAIFDDGELVFYTLVTFKGTFYERINDAFLFVYNRIVKEWDPDYIIFEDVQFQRNYKTYKQLSMLLGALHVAASSQHVKSETILAKKWRSNYQIANKRAQAKREAVRTVEQMYDIKVVHDVAEAILIGKYYADELYKQNVKQAF